MTYEERYGEQILSEQEERELEERIKTQEKIEMYEKTFYRIKMLLTNLKEEEYEEIIKEIKWEIENI